MYQSAIDVPVIGRAGTVSDGMYPYPRTVREAESYLDFDPYRLSAASQAVPRRFLGRLPLDLANIRQLSARQKSFVRALLPLVLRGNEVMMLQRRAVLMATRDRPADDAAMSGIMRVLREVPVSLLLALAAVHTDWGRRPSGAGLRCLFPESLSLPLGIDPAAAQAAGGISRARHPHLLAAVLDVIHGLNRLEFGTAFEDERHRQCAQRRPDGYRLALLLTSTGGPWQRHADQLLCSIEGAALSGFDRMRLSAPETVLH